MLNVSAFVVHIDVDGNHDFLAFGSSDARFLVIDERAPHDRVYAVTLRLPRSELARLIGDSPVGDMHDDRHPALAARIKAALTGQPHLAVVDD